MADIPGFITLMDGDQLLAISEKRLRLKNDWDLKYQACYWLQRQPWECRDVPEGCDFTVEQAEEDGVEYVSIGVVAPAFLKKKQVQGFFDQCGRDLADYRGKPEERFRFLCQEAIVYGTCVTLEEKLFLWEGDETGISWALDTLKNNPAYGMMLGFTLDGWMNAIGNSGWDFLSGDIGFKRG